MAGRLDARKRIGGLVRELSTPATAVTMRTEFNAKAQRSQTATKSPARPD